MQKMQKAKKQKKKKNEMQVSIQSEIITKYGLMSTSTTSFEIKKL
jgi:shikimate kinase